MKALLVVDWEKEWIDPESDYYIGNDLSVETKRINKLIDWARKKNFKIIFMRHLEREENAFKEGTKGAELIESLDVTKDDVIIDKYKISSFYQTSLAQELEGIGEIYVCGGLINACVRSLVCEAYDRDFQVNIVKDCCTSFDQETHDFTLKDITFVRPEVEVIKSTDVV
jgi:nicotinamidase-related amidase